MSRGMGCAHGATLAILGAALGAVAVYPTMARREQLGAT